MHLADNVIITEIYSVVYNENSQKKKINLEAQKSI